MLGVLGVFGWWVDLTEQLSNILAEMIAYMVIVLIAIVVVIFLSLALALHFNVVFESNSLGFVVVAGLYLIPLMIMFYLLKSGKLKLFFESKLMETVPKNWKTTDGEKE